VVANLNQGQFYELTTNGMMEFSGTQPIQVAQFANGEHFDNAVPFDNPYYSEPNLSSPNPGIGDPTMMLLTPAGRFMTHYTIPIPIDLNASPVETGTETPIGSIWSNPPPSVACYDSWGYSWGCYSPTSVDYVNLIVEQSATNETYVYISGQPKGQPVSGFRPIGSSGFYGAQVPVTANANNGSSLTVSSSKPLGVQVYGFAYYDAYGFMGGLNTAPLVAVPDAFKTDSAGATVDVLANDIYSNRTSVTVSIQQPAHGTNVLNADKTVTYTPKNNYSGNDSFAYQIAENGNTSASTVTMWVNNINPVALDVMVSTTNDWIHDGICPISTYGTPVVIHVLNSDSDQDGDPISILSVGPSGWDSGTSTPYGDVWFNPTDNTITYATETYISTTSTYNDSFNYTITDGRGGTATATVTITNNWIGKLGSTPGL
jgi:hypothetical protein